MKTLARFLAILSLITHCARPADAPIAATTQNGFRAEAEQLQNDLAVLRHKPDLNLDLWADAQIFVKAVVWTLDFEPTLGSKQRELIDKAIRRGRERLAALSTANAPWISARGSGIRGFVSKIDGSTQPYGLVIPARYNPAQPIRLDVVLHGSRRAAGIGELLFLNDFDRGDGPAQAAEHDYIEVHPLGRLGENAYRFEGETDVDEAIAAVSRRYNIDRKRIVLRGSSLGGVGTWQLGLKRPDRYAALGPTAGPVDTFEFANSPWPHFVRLEPLTPWQETMLHLVDAIDYAANATMVPVVAAMGDKDPYYSSHLLMQKAFEKEGVRFVGLVDHGAGHAVRPAVLEQQLKLIAERVAHGIDPAPKEIRFVTWTLKFSRCHWIEVLGLAEHYKRSEIKASMDDQGSITVNEQQNITRFAIHPPMLGSSSATVTIGGKKMTVPHRPGRQLTALVFELHKGTWRYAGDLREIQFSGKQPGLQGPIDDAFAAPFLCVRGTGKPWNRAVAAWADAQLNRFAYEWRRHYRGDLIIKSDKDVTPDDLRQRNLILFGDPGNNRWIREIAGELPLTWSHKEIRLGKQRYPAADHGLQLIQPNPLPDGRGHYVVFNSGHTYHDSELRFSYMVFPRLGDWAVMKVGDNQVTASPPKVEETVLRSGFFDEDWQVR